MAAIALPDYFELPTGAKYFTRKDDRVYHSIEGALSFGFYDRAVSIGSNRVNDLSASVLGRPWRSEPVNATYPLITKTPAIGAKFESPEAFDYRVTGIAPVDEPETHTLILFMSAANGTGTIIAMVPFNLFEQFSPAIPVRY